MTQFLREMNIILKDPNYYKAHEKSPEPLIASSEMIDEPLRLSF